MKRTVKHTYRWGRVSALLRHWLLPKRHFLGGSVAEYLVVCLFFAVVTAYFTNWVVFDISHRLFVSGPGDGTSGFLWLNYADQDLNPFLGNTNLVNYPNGVDLGSPLFVTYTALWIPLWVLSRLFSPITALNLVTFWGIMSSGIAMYWLMKRLTYRYEVALFSGFAAAFVPYHIIKSSAHLAYIFSVVFILQLAAVIAIWRRPTYWRSVLLAASVALGFYTDGYYILLGTVFVALLLAGACVYEYARNYRQATRHILGRVKYLFVAGCALAVMLLPIAVVQVMGSKAVKNDLARARGDSVSDLYFYAGNAIDYVLPPMESRLLQNNQTFKELQSYKNQRSNPSESTLYVGYTLLLLMLCGIVTLLVYIAKRASSSLSQLSGKDRSTFLLLMAMGIVAVPSLFLLSLPPMVNLAGHIVKMPSDVLLHFHISFWRVMGRFFLPLHVMVVAMAGLSLHVLLQTSKRFGLPSKTSSLQLGRLAVVLVLTIVLCAEYLTTFNNHGYDFNAQPPAFSWLRDQKDIQAVVEFPLVAKPWDYAVDAVTTQMIHNKKLINLHLPTQDTGLRNALGNINNPEAVDLAVAHGAQIGITRGEKCNLQYPWLKLAYDGSSGIKHRGKVCMYYLSAATNDKVFPYLGSGFTDTPLLADNQHLYNKLYGNYADIRVVDAQDAIITTGRPIRFTAILQHTPGERPFTGSWKVLQGSQVLASGEITGEQQVAIDVVFDASKPLEFRQQTTDGKDPSVGQLSLSNVSVTAQ